MQLFIRNEYVFCCKRVYFSADSNSTLKNISLLMTQKKKSPVIFKGSTKSAITLHSMHVFSVQQTAMCVYGSTEDHMCDDFYLHRNEDELVVNN